jgi:hypothetical protein
MVLTVAGASCAAALSRAATTPEPLVGRWEVAGGLFEFVQQRPGTFTSRVIRQRAGVPCPRVNDKHGQIVVEKKGERLYVGTWAWFLTPSCRPAGKGPTTITVARNGETARLVSRPPPGVRGQVTTLMLARAGATGGAARLLGTVGPGFTISLTDAPGRRVTSLRPGRYTFAVNDRSSIHNFRLTGPGVNRAITSVPFVGQATFAATLRAGTYRFLCDPHEPAMNGSFAVR